MGLEHVELISALEQRFGIEFPDPMLIAPRFRTVAEVEDMVVVLLARHSHRDAVEAVEAAEAVEARRQVREILGRILGLDPTHLRPQHELIRDLGMG
jgi:hypothetical protein